MTDSMQNRIVWDGRTVTAAERMLELAQAVKYPSNVVMLIDGEGMQPDTFSRIKTALELAKLPAVTRMRAILEDWDMVRIIRECY